VLSSWGGTSFDVTFATDDINKLAIGLRLESETYELAHGIGVQFMAQVDAGQFKVTATDIKTDGVLRKFDLSVQICHPESTAQYPRPLFEYTPYPKLPPLPDEPKTADAPAVRLILGVLRAGVSVSLSGRVQTPVPSLRLIGVTLRDEQFDLDLLTTKKRPAGAPDSVEFPDDFSTDNVTTLLKVIGGALQDTWDRYQPSQYASLETNVERIFRGDDYKAIIDKMLKLSGPQVSGQQVTDIPTLLVEFGEWITTSNVDDLPKEAFQWLIGSGNVFGLLGGLLSLKIPEFRGEGSLLTYAPWQDFTVSIGKPPVSKKGATKTDAKTETDAFGIWIRPRAELGAVSLSGEASLVFKEGIDHAPVVTATAQVGLADASLASLKAAGFDVNPELAVTLGDNASSFSIDIYPLGSSADDAFLMVVLPSDLQPPYLAYKNEPGTHVAADKWFLRLLPRVMLPFFEERLLNEDSVKEILQKSPLGGEFTAATVLMDWGVLSQDAPNKYRLAKLDALSELRPDGLFKSIVTGFEAVPNLNLTLLKIGSNGGGVFFHSQKGPEGTDYTDYGLRLQITEIEFSAKNKDDGKANRSAKASAKLQLGKWINNPAENNPSENWITSGSNAPVEIEPGLTMTFLRLSKGDSLEKGTKAEFKPGIELVSVGLDIEGAKDRPLFNKNGYQLKGLQSRLYFAWEHEKDPKFGAAVQLKEIGIPLGPKSGGGAGGNNPVASNLLGSGGGKGEKTDAVNPTFSAVVAYAGEFYGKVFSDIPSADGKAWIPVSRNFGPLHCRQIGLGFDNKNVKLGIGYDGGVALGPLNIDLDHLTIDIPLKEPQNLSQYELGLAGLDVSYAGGPISVSGGFFKNEIPILDASGKKILDENGKSKITTQYDGMALIKAADFTITGFGSYAVIAHEPSLFIFAILHKDLGGPSFFHVTGLAAGFGYNRKLKLPPIEEVHNFPLVRGALEENYFDGTDPQHSIQGAMEKLHDYIPPSRGDYWFAAGVRFNSFEMFESFVLLSVSFGHEVEIGLLGMSKMTVPKDAQPGSEVAYAELAIRAVLKPEEGSIMVEGRLTDASYIFSKDCHLTGGFGFGTWLSGPNAGDFVVTLGGYHPEFKRPDHYPVVPRLGINWRKGSLTITGEEYYALTPSCLMAGGKLIAVYEVSCIKAWFTAYADFLLNWQPFYYRADMGIHLGVKASVRISLGFATITISISVELGVDLHLWGPSFGGEAHVDLSVISFAIPFGDPLTPPPALDAQKFIDNCLPATASETIAVRINAGLLRQKEGQEKVLRVVNAHALSLTAESLIPSTEFGGLATGAKYEDPKKLRPALDKDFGIRPMGKQRLNSTFKVLLRREIGDVYKDQGTPENLRARFVVNGVPEALWGPSETEGVVALPETPLAKTISATLGIRFSFDPKKPQHALPPMEILQFAYENFYKLIPWCQSLRPAEDLLSDDFTKVLKDQPTDNVLETVMSEPKAPSSDDYSVVGQRDEILEVLLRESPVALNTVDLSHFAKGQEHYFQAPPKICRLGEAFV
jgi:hypothetical protein